LQLHFDWALTYMIHFCDLWHWSH